MSRANEQPFNILIADDDPGVTSSGRMLFEDEGWRVSVARSPNEAIKKIEAQEFDLALFDMNYSRDTTSGIEGLELIEKTKACDPDLPIVVMTAWGTISIAVEAMKGGAADFVNKPWDNEGLVQKIAKMAEVTRSLRRSRLLEEEVRINREASAPPSNFVANSEAMREVLDIIQRISPSEANVMLLGENGTGKSMVARLIHDHSMRREGPFISVNMGGLAAGIFESEIFGHVKGAFTDAKADRAGRFELANGGTLFMDEIGNLSMPQQNRLLHVLETGEFERVGSSRTIRADARIVSATNAPIQENVADRAFREDLFYRLNTVVMEMPPLRSRREDLLPLAHHFLERMNSKYRKSIAGFHSEARKTLEHYDWPGNIREMAHAIERAVLMCQGDEITNQHLMIESQQRLSNALDYESMSLEEVEKTLMDKALKRNGGNVTQAAKQLGLSRATFYRRLQEYGL
jgi:DNA-binding NtrC family response regulator